LEKEPIVKTGICKFWKAGEDGPQNMQKKIACQAEITEDHQITGLNGVNDALSWNSDH
jgi:hypothetical protein